MEESKERFVFPGDYLGASEEATAGKGAYESENEVFASLAGRVVREHGEVSIIPKKEIIHIKPGQIVYGIVVDVMENLALIEIEPLVRGRERFVPAWDYGVLRVMNIREGFVQSVKTEMKRGDIIKAKVEDIRLGISLSTKGFDLGVVKAYCAECRGEMKLLHANILKCTKCGKTDKRKVSKSYSDDVVLNEIKF